MFQIVELDATAADDVAFAFAVLRCSTPSDFDRTPIAGRSRRPS
jgi:hypothetical protein